MRIEVYYGKRLSLQPNVKKVVIDRSGAVLGNNMVTWAVLNDEFKKLIYIDDTGVIDWKEAVIFKKELTGQIDFSFQNVELGKTITVLLKGDYPFTFVDFTNVDIFENYNPAAWNVLQFKAVDVDNGVYKFIGSFNNLL